MTAGGDIANGNEFPGLLGGANVLFDIPWTFLAPGSTATRPTPSPAINYRLRFNTDDQLYEYYDAVLGLWTQIQESAFTVGPFITYTADSSLPDAQNLGALANGILKQTITTGVATLDIAANGVDYYGPGFTGYFQAPTGIKDANGNIVLAFLSMPSAVNYIGVTNNSSGFAVELSAFGSDTDIPIDIVSKGAAPVRLIGGNTTLGFNVFNGTAQQHSTLFSFSNTAATQTVTFKDASGTVAFLSDIPAGTPSALTEVNDTNITLTLGGTPATALLQAVSITAGWTGTLSPARGGTGENNGSNTLTLAGNLATSGAFSSTFTMTAATSVTFPTSGTLATTSQLPSPAALTVSPDTNVTITLGGTPSTALLQATSITLGWTGTLSGTRGGTGVNNGASTITLGGSLTTSGAFASTFTMTGATNVTFPTSGTLATTATASGIVNSGLINQMAWYAASGTTLSGLATAASGVLVTSAGSVPSISTTLPNGLAMGTPASITLTNGTGLPIAGITGLGTGVATALSANVNGSGAISLTTNAVFVTPTLGVAAATSINKVTITTPATGSTLTIADGKTLNASNTLTLSGTDSAAIAFGAGGTVAYTSSGTFVPVLRFGGASVGITYSVQTGYYTTHGNTLTFAISIILSSKGSSTGAATISGLPVASRAGPIDSFYSYGSTNLVFTLQPLAAIDGGASIVQLIANNSAGALTVFTDTNFANNTAIYITGTYLI